MNTFVFTILAASVAAPGLKDGKPAATGLVGKWKLESTTLNGNPLPPGDLTVSYLADGRFVQGQGENVTKGTYTIDPKKDPAELDSQHESAVAGGALPPVPWPAIYKIDGDTMTICVSVKSSMRPTTFNATPGSGLIVSVFKREKR